MNDSVDLRLEELGFGQKLGRYTLIRRISSGSAAEIYSARTEAASGAQKRVAIKRILPQLSKSEALAQQLVDEAKAAELPAHANIAQVFELEKDGEYFLVMEYVEGCSLAKLLARCVENRFRAIPPALAVHIMSAVAKGLDHAHKNRDADGRILHCEVSPENILLPYEGGVKLTGFAVAREAGPAARRDIQSCGELLAQLLGGQRNIPAGLMRILERTSSSSRDERFQTARELSAELRLVLRQHYPEMLESDLGDFVTGLFAEEMIADQELENAGEQKLTSFVQTLIGDEPRWSAPEEPLTELPAETAELFYVMTGESEALDDVFSDQDVSVMMAPVPAAAARKKHVEVQSELTELGTGEHHEEPFVSEEVILDTSPSVAPLVVPVKSAEKTPQQRPLTDWRPKRFSWASLKGTWSIGQVAAVAVLLGIGGVALAVAGSSADELPQPVVVAPIHAPVIPAPVVHLEEAEAEPQPELAPTRTESSEKVAKVTKKKKSRAKAIAMKRSRVSRN